jgi:pyruvate dehydrogenase E2 component (dihydrolipoamide acetyltransferase)
MSAPTVPIAMPKLGMAMTEGRIVAWPRAPGARVARGEIVLVIETEKAEVEIEAPAAGYLRHVYVEADRTVACGTLLAALTPSADEPFDADAFRGEHDRSERRVAGPTRSAAAPLAARRIEVARGTVPSTPAARAFATQYGIDVAKVAGSGPEGRVTREDVEAYVAARERLVAAGGGVMLEVVAQGTGEPVVLVPGFGSDVSMFARLTPPLAECRRVLGVNPRGIGLSDAPEEDVYDLATVAREVLAIAAEPAHMVGASLGAAVAIEAALLAPERVRSLTLITPFGTASPRLLAVLDAWCRVAAEAAPTTLATMLLPWMFSAEFLTDERARRRTLRGLTEMVTRVPAASLLRYAAGLRQWSGRRLAELARVAVPTLVVAGAEDLLTPDPREIADAIPGARFVIVGGAGHAVALEAPDAVNAAILDHI